MIALIALFTLFIVITSYMVYSSIISEQMDRSTDLEAEREAKREAMRQMRPKLTLPKPATRGFEEWLINPSMPIRLVVKGLRQEHVENLHNWLNDENSFYVTKERRDKILTMFGQNGALLPDLESYILDYQRKIQDLITERKTAFEGWSLLPENEQNKHLTTWFKEVQNELDEAVCVDISKFEPLSEAQRAIANAFNKRFGFENLRFYSTIDQIGVPQQVEMNAYAKMAYEGLYSVGLAKKGNDIKIQDYLNTFTIKQLSDLAISNNGIFNSKEDAISYITHDFASMEHLEKKTNFKTLYQSIPIEDISAEFDTQTLRIYSKYYEVLTDLFVNTFQHGLMSQQFKYDYEEASTKINYEIKRNNSICNNTCKKAKQMTNKTYKYRDLPNIPVHIGCTCVYSEYVKV